MVEEIERIYDIPLRGAKHKSPKGYNAPGAIKEIKRFVSHHMKVDMDNVWIDPHVNELIWKTGIEHIPEKVKLKVIKFEDGLVEVDMINKPEEIEPSSTNENAVNEVTEESKLDDKKE
ncbi:MAG: 50S ribosomal protein L31e [Thermoplasmata archaeon]